jgi:hypothetical protein
MCSARFALHLFEDKEEEGEEEEETLPPELVRILFGNWAQS